MASIMGVETLQHTNGTTAAEIKSDGTFYPAGGIVQVVTTTKSDTFTTSSTSYVDITGLSVSITPKSTSSKILVTFGLDYGCSSGRYNNQVKVLEDSTSIYETQARVYEAGEIHHLSSQILSSPSTTSQLTYKFQAKVESGTTFTVNRRGADTTYGGSSFITVMEIAG